MFNAWMYLHGVLPRVLWNLGRQLKFTTNIATTSLHPDIVLTLESTNQVVLLELTVSCEDLIDKTNECKRSKYSELTAAYRSRGWKPLCEPIEIVAVVFQLTHFSECQIPWC